MRPEICPKLNLEKTPGLTPVWVSMESFFEFSFWIAEELEDLVAKYRLDQNKPVATEFFPTPGTAKKSSTPLANSGKPSAK